MEKIYLVLDCGATSVRAVAVGERGKILAQASRPNQPYPQEGCENCLIWDEKAIWKDFCDVTKKVLSDIDGIPAAVTVTAFGADGVPVRSDGTLTYPVISWQCTRTVPWLNRLASTIDPREVFRITGYQFIPFNTLFKLLWLRENAPHSLDEADTYLMMPGLFAYRLCGEMSIDLPSASTTMMLDAGRRRWSERLLSLAGLTADFFPPLVEAGDIIGTVSEEAHHQTSLPVGIPVTAAGHDTQFAIMGSLSTEGEIVLSSGTWEIAALRVPEYRDTNRAFELGMLTELDAENGLWNPQMLMISGGVVEWVRRNFFADIKDNPNIYRFMIERGERVAPGSNNVVLVPSFMPSGPNKPLGTRGTIVGLGLTTERGQIYRAALEGLSYQLKQAVTVFQEVFHYQPSGVRVVGGGAKNSLWNQIRADVLDLPVLTSSVEEATVLGAALFAMVGSGACRNLGEAREMVELTTHMYQPSPLTERYGELFEEYEKIPHYLAHHYKKEGPFV